MSVRLARAKRIGRLAAVLMLLGLTAQADPGEPFGLTTALLQGPLAATWHELQAQMMAERPIIAHCRAARYACRSIPAQKFIALVDEGRDVEGLVRIGRINRAVNFAIRAVKAGAPDTTRDKWTSPLEALAAGEGDCKQYAVLKYAALQAAGFTADDVRIVVLEQRQSPETHAMVAVRNEGRWLILDNRVLTIVDARDLLGRYRPLYEFGRRGVREFVPRPQRTAQNFGAACAG